jgi:hypothetical protein
MYLADCGADRLSASGCRLSEKVFEFRKYLLNRGVEKPWCVNAIMAQGRYDGLCVPTYEGCLGEHALLLRGPASQRRRVGLCSGLNQCRQAEQDQNVLDSAATASAFGRPPDDDHVPSSGVGTALLSRVGCSIRRPLLAG